MKRLYFVYLIIVFSTLFVNAQNTIKQVIGVAMDKDNNPIIKDTIEIINLFYGEKETVTDNEGKFIFGNLRYEKNGNFILKLKINGYNEIETTVSLKGSKVVDLGNLQFAKTVFDTVQVLPSEGNNISSKDTVLVNEKKIPIKDSLKRLGYLKFNETVKKKDLGFSIQYSFLKQQSNLVEAQLISSDYRRVPPHPEDLSERPGDILDVNIPDNYFIQSNAVSFNLINQNSIQFDLNFFHHFSISLKTTDLLPPSENSINYHHRKDYISPNHGGSSFIYYEIKTKERRLFSSGSFSIPATFKFPFYYNYNQGKNTIYAYPYFGSNILLPPVIKVISEKGWERYGDYEIYENTEVGTLKELELFLGLEVEIPVSKFLFIGANCEWVDRKFKTNINTMEIISDKSNYLSLGLSLICNLKD